MHNKKTRVAGKAGRTTRITIRIMISFFNYIIHTSYPVWGLVRTTLALSADPPCTGVARRAAATPPTHARAQPET